MASSEPKPDRQAPTPSDGSGDRNAWGAFRAVLVPIHPAGWPFIGACAAVTGVLWLVVEPLAWPGLLVTFWCAYFFRNPDRVTPAREGLLVSPADGVVQSIEAAAPPPELDMGTARQTRVAIFMNVFDVHVNRVPVDGRIMRLAYRPGRFFNASLDKASEDNERHGVVIRTTDGADVAVVQIAGLVARRIRCFLAQDQVVRAGERFGLIRFGSRVDVYLPDGVAPLVAVGQRAVAGETVIADARGTEPPRSGEVR